MSAEKVPAEAVEVVGRVEPLIRSLPAAKQQEIREVITTAIAYQGPLPPPSMLEEYGQVVPGSPERLIRLLEKQTDHRIQMESTLVNGQVGSVVRGQWMAFILSILFGAAGLWLGLTGHEKLAAAIYGTTIVGLATVFIVGRVAGRPPAPTPEEPEEAPEPPPPTRPPQRGSAKKGRR